MQFHAFQKIPTSTNAYTLSKKDAKVLFDQMQWVVTEKIHGANFSIYHQPAADASASAAAASVSASLTTRFAKRTAFLAEDEWFYDAQSIYERLTTCVTTLGVELTAAGKLPSGGYLIVYGELFGGFYPDGGAASNSLPWAGAVAAGRVNAKQECVLPLEARAVQEGIYYAPEVDFVAFDIAVVTSDHTRVEFLSVDTVERYAKAAGFHTLPRLLTGSFKQAMAYPYENFDSSFARTVLGRAPLPKGTNRAEGVVLRPTEPYYITDASASSSSSSANSASASAPIRCLVKLKSSAFAEISGDFTAPTATPTMRLLALVNAPRIAALQSKHDGRITWENLDRMVDLLAEDCWADLYEQQPAAAAQIVDYEAENAKLLQKCRDALSKAIVP